MKTHSITLIRFAMRHNNNSCINWLFCMCSVAFFFSLISWASVSGELTAEGILYVAIVPLDQVRDADVKSESAGVAARVCSIRTDSVGHSIFSPILIFDNQIIYSFTCAPDRSFFVISGLFGGSDQLVTAKYIVSNIPSLDVKSIEDTSDIPTVTRDYVIERNGKYNLAYLIVSSEDLAKLNVAKNDEERLSIRETIQARPIYVNTNTAERSPAALSDWNFVVGGEQLSLSDGVRFQNRHLQKAKVEINFPSQLVRNDKWILIEHNSETHMLCRGEDGRFLLLEKSTQEWSEFGKKAGYTSWSVIDNCFVAQVAGREKSRHLCGVFGSFPLRRKSIRA